MNEEEQAAALREAGFAPVGHADPRAADMLRYALIMGGVEDSWSKGYAAGALNALCALGCVRRVEKEEEDAR